MNTLGLKNFKLDGSTTEKRTVLVGSEEECHRMEKLMKNTGLPQAVVGFIHPQDTDSENSTYIGSITQLPELINIFKINEIIFSAKSVAANDIMTTMADLSSRNPEFKIAPEDSQFIIGSNSIHQKGNWYSEDISFNINKPTQQRYKRLFDVSLAVLLLIASPISYFIVNQKEAFFSNCIAIIFGTKTWVAYAPTVSLPKLLPGVWQPADMHNKTFSTQDIFRINLWYAKDYQVGNDWEVVWKKLF